MNQKAWEIHFAEQKNSGLNIKEYCDRNNLYFKEFVDAKHLYAPSDEESSFVSVLMQTPEYQGHRASIKISCGAASATIDKCTPEWFAQFIREVV